jgi:putative transposase
LIGISRASLAYTPTISIADLKAMNALDAIYTKCPFYGSRRMRYELKRLHGIEIGRDHVRRLMGMMGLKALYPKKNTSTQNPAHRVYPYLLKNIIASYPSHVWGTDITYIRLAHGFCYLVAILDWYSRYVVAWELSSSLEIGFTIRNLEKALETGTPIIHNSDQGSHFTSPQRTNILESKNIAISMDGRGRCMDNIFTERLWRTVKYEEVYLKGYATIEEARQSLTAYFRFYNDERPHQSLEYRTPAEVYAETKKAVAAHGATTTELPSAISTILV